MQLSILRVKMGDRERMIGQRSRYVSDFCVIGAYDDILRPL
jgi:hypothetical protein